jgi:hypothetical protein
MYGLEKNGATWGRFRVRRATLVFLAPQVLLVCRDSRDNRVYLVFRVNRVSRVLQVSV